MSKGRIIAGLVVFGLWMSGGLIQLHASLTVHERVFKTLSVSPLETEATLVVNKVEETLLTTVVDEGATTNLVVNEEAIIEVANVETAVIGRILGYPSPFSFSSGDGRISYWLNVNADITMEVYDMAANQVYKHDYSAGATGGAEGYNEIPLTRTQIKNDLSSGVYLVFLIHDGKLLKKGKIGVLP